MRESISRPLRVAVIGMGGFAADHHYALKTLEAAGQCRVIAACDPAPNAHAALVTQGQFAARGIPIYDDYRQMLDRHAAELDFVTVPTPILWHAPMHRSCVERGIACYLEKPPTLCPQELKEMLEVETAARQCTQVGFAHIVEAPRLALKERILAGEFGKIEQAGFYGYAPRQASYFRRTPWAGRLEVDGRLVLDSCIGNAMAHFVHNLLFWCGQSEILAWEKVETLEAELYRAHDIESFDTCFARGHCHNGVKIRVAATHTGNAEPARREWIECEHATIHYVTEGDIHTLVRWNDGGEERECAAQDDLLLQNLCSYIAYLSGTSPRPLTRLIDTQPFVEFNSALYLAAGEIVSIPEKWLASNCEGGWLAVEQMEPAMASFCSSGLFPGEARIPWGATPGHRATQSRYFERVLAQIAGCTANSV